MQATAQRCAGQVTPVLNTRLAPKHIPGGYPGAPLPRVSRWLDRFPSPWTCGSESDGWLPDWEIDGRDQPQPVLYHHFPNRPHTSDVFTLSQPLHRVRGMHWCIGLPPPAPCRHRHLPPLATCRHLPPAACCPLPPPGCCRLLPPAATWPGWYDTAQGPGGGRDAVRPRGR